jgi:predicted flap endonuclease-1-like 5' DNA nuclease
MTGIVWILVAFGLWALRPWARLFAMIVAGFALFEAVIAFFQFPGSGAGFAMGLMPLLILWYLGTRDVRMAFGEGEPEMAAPEPTVSAAPVVAAAAVAAPEPAAPAPVAPVAAAAPMAAMADETPAADPAAEEASPPPADQTNIADVEGIGPAFADKLRAIGIKTTDDLLMAGATHEGRVRIAEQAGLSGDLVRTWVDKADLMRVPGIGPQYSDLLVAAGVDSPAELVQRNPANLAITLQEVVAARPGIVRRIPSEADVAEWIAAAAQVEKVVEH